MDPKLLCWNTARTIKASPSNSRPVIPVQHMAAAPRWRARLFIKAWRGLPANDRQRQTLPCAWRGEGCLKELSSRKSLKVLINSFNCSGMGANLQFRARNHGSWIDQSVTLGSGHPSSSPTCHFRRNPGSPPKWTRKHRCLPTLTRCDRVRHSTWKCYLAFWHPIWRICGSSLFEDAHWVGMISLSAIKMKDVFKRQPP